MRPGDGQLFRGRGGLPRRPEHFRGGERHLVHGQLPVRVFVGGVRGVQALRQSAGAAVLHGAAGAGGVPDGGAEPLFPGVLLRLPGQRLPAQLPGRRLLSGGVRLPSVGGVAGVPLPAQGGGVPLHAGDGVPGPHLHRQPHPVFLLRHVADLGVRGLRIDLAVHQHPERDVHAGRPHQALQPGVPHPLPALPHPAHGPPGPLLRHHDRHQLLQGHQRHLRPLRGGRRPAGGGPGAVRGGDGEGRGRPLRRGRVRGHHHGGRRGGGHADGAHPGPHGPAEPGGPAALRHHAVHGPGGVRPRGRHPGHLPAPHGQADVRGKAPALRRREP